jgi:Zn-dependent protease with chaperone function
VFSARAFQRLEFALGALGLTAASVVFVVTLDAVQFHAAAFLDCACHLRVGDLGLEGWAFVVLGVVDAIVFARGGWSLLRQLQAHRAFRRRLPVVGEAQIDGETLRVVPGPTPHAFCAGLLRPAVYASEGLLRDSGSAELRAIVAHEGHHRRRRDPLRLLVARVMSDAFRPLPSLATLADRHGALAELAADAAAVRALGDVQPVASALVRFDEMHAAAGGGVAPERVDQLIGRTAPPSIPPWLLAAATLGIAALWIPMLALGWHPDPALPISIEAAAIAAACSPSYLAARRVDACLRPPV